VQLAKKSRAEEEEKIVCSSAVLPPDPKERDRRKRAGKEALEKAAGLIVFLRL